MALKYTNNADSTIASAINSSVTTITLATGDGAKFPALGSGDYFYATLVGIGSTEIVKVTARSTDTLTVVRGQDNTTAASWDAGTKFALRVCAAMMEEFQPYDADLTAWAGKTAPIGDAVGTSDAQTLTNKTLTSPTISGGTANNVAIGGTTPAAGNFTTLGATGNVTLGDANTDTLTINAGTTTFAQGTANGVLYLNGSKVATSNSALTYNGTNLGLGIATPTVNQGNAIHVNDATQSALRLTNSTSGTASGNGVNIALFTNDFYINNQGGPTIFYNSGSEQGRLTSKGLLVGYTSDGSLSGTGNAIFSGNVGIGTSSTFAKLGVVGNVILSGAAPYISLSSVQSGSTPCYWQWNSSTGVSTFYNYGIVGGNNGQFVWVPGNGTQAMTLDASGKLLVGTTSAYGIGGLTTVPGGAAAAILSWNKTNTGNEYAAQFRYSGTIIGSIEYSSTAVSYITSSDQRLKANIAPAGSAIQSILDFPVDQFDWISSGEHQDFGGIAQKIIPIIPEMVSVPEDPEEMMGVDWSKAVPRLIRAYQELHAEIETLKQRIH